VVFGMTLEYMAKQFLASSELPWVERHLTWLGAFAIEELNFYELVVGTEKSAGRGHEESLRGI